MERMRELVQNTTSGSTELAASAEQMSKMSRDLLDSMGRFALDQTEAGVSHREEKAGGRGRARHAAAGSEN
jgi:hypothetical protein